MGGYPSGQREQTVNLLALPAEVQILLPPSFLSVGDASLWRPKQNAGVAQLVEHWPSKPIVAGSSPVSRFQVLLRRVCFLVMPT